MRAVPPRTPKKAPAPAAPVSRDELTAVAREALRALPGLRAADLKKKLPKPLQARHAEVLDVLRELAASGEVFRHVTAKTERFFASDPVATLDRIVPEVLTGAGPLTSAALKKAVVVAAPGHDDLLAAWLKTAVARRVIFEHGPAPKRYGSTPDLVRWLAKTLVEMKKVLPAIDDAGVPRERVIEAIRKAIGLPNAPPPPLPPSSSDRDVVQTALAQLASERPPGTLLHVRDLRERTPLDKERFDAAALALSREGIAVLHHHDHPAALSEQDRLALVTDGRGTFFIGIAPRSPE